MRKSAAFRGAAPPYSDFSRSRALSGGDTPRIFHFAATGVCSPRMDIVYAILVGAAAGWLAGQLVKGRGFGFVGNVVVGILGGVVGGIVFPLLGIGAGSVIGKIVLSALGAVILFVVFGALRGRRRR